MNREVLRQQAFRAVCFLTSGAMFFTSSAAGISACVSSVTELAHNRGGISRKLKQIPSIPMYSNSPGIANTGTNPGKNLQYRGGLYNDDALNAISIANQVDAGTLNAPAEVAYNPNGAIDTGDDNVFKLRPKAAPKNVPLSINQFQEKFKTIFASTFGDVMAFAPPAGNGSGPSAGGAFQWEGSAPAGGSSAAPGQVNLVNGNRLTTLPLGGWSLPGDLGMGLVLYHNSEDGRDIGWGENWRCNYDMEIVVGNPTSGGLGQVTVNYPDGRQLVFTESSATSNIYFAPAGVYDVLSKVNTGHTWQLRTKNQISYIFSTLTTTNGNYVSSISDRYGNTVDVSRSNGMLTQVYNPKSAKEVINFTYNSKVVNGNTYRYYTNATVPNQTGTNNTFSFNIGQAYNGQAFSLLESVTYPTISGNSSVRESFAYDGNGAILSETAKDGSQYTFTYDTSERLLSYAYQVHFYTNPLGPTGDQGNLTYRFTYNPTNTVEVEPFYDSSTNNTTTNYTTNYSGGLSISTVDEAGFTTNLTWDSNGNLTNLQDENGNTSNYSYDNMGNMLTSQTPLQASGGKNNSYTWNSYNDILSQTDTRGYSTHYVRDQTTGVLISETDGLNNNLFTNTYNPDGTLASSNSETKVTNVTYTNGRPTTITTPVNSYIVTYNPSAPWMVTSIKDNLARTTTFAYDDWGRSLSDTRPDGSIETTNLDLMGRPVSHVDFNGHTSTASYDAAGRLTNLINPRGDYSFLKWADMSQVVGTVDGNGNTKQYNYTPRGEVYSLWMPDNTYEAYTHDGDGNQNARWNGLGQETNYVFNADDELTQQTYPTSSSTPNVNFTYDLDGRMKGYTDGSGFGNWTYDAAGNTTQYAQGQGTVNYSYDQWGRKTQIDEGGGVKIQYAYTGTQLTTVTKQPENEATQFIYDSIGRLHQQSNSDSTFTVYGYDTLDRIASIIHQWSTGIFQSDNYAYDANSNLISKTSSNSGTTSYAYDYGDQLISEVAPGFRASYTYDGNGNRKSKTLNNGTPDLYTYDPGDKLLNVKNNGTTVKSYSYDAAGRTTSVSTPTATTNLWYDCEDRLTSLTGNGLNDGFSSNAFDTRVQKTDASGVHNYMRDGGGPTDSLLSDGASTFNPGISQRTSSTTTVNHYNYLGSVTAQTTGLAESNSNYDAFGNLTTGPPAGPFGFAGGYGYQTDSDTGLQLLGHRYYDPSVGRFITRDPAQDGSNWYRYCKSNPLNNLDIDGLGVINWIIGEVMGIGGKAITKPDGGKIIIGGLAGYFNPKGNAITLGDDQFLKDEDTYEQYSGDSVKSQNWRRHENRHSYQADVLGDFFLPVYGVGALVGFADEYFKKADGIPMPKSNNPIGHDSNPLEIDADNQRSDHKYKNPWSPFSDIYHFLYGTKK